MAEEYADRHLNAAVDTGDAYHTFQGWKLTCLWCGTFPAYSVYGTTKAEALEKMQNHYDTMTHEKAGKLR